jgi:hypothetical protein
LSAKGEADRKIAELAGAMLAGQCDLLKGCLAMWPLIWSSSNPEAEKYLPFIGVHSEIDGYRPADDPWFSAEYKKRVHADAIARVAALSGLILAACQRIVDEVA